MTTAICASRVASERRSVSEFVQSNECEAFLRWSSDCMNVDNVFILEKVKEELMRRIEADAKGGG